MQTAAAIDSLTVAKKNSSLPIYYYDDGARWSSADFKEFVHDTEGSENMLCDLITLLGAMSRGS